MSLLQFSPEVADALKRGLPLVALESTVISHGMPYPQNMETALTLQAVVRENGAVPATIAVIKGVPKVGLTDEEIKLLARAGREAVKMSRRDFAVVLAQKKTGATTVAGTMILAEKAGIRVFATGGIGGVHRDALRTMDISADLQELARTRVAVVSAGVKSILDLGLTLEYLETMGVPVIGYQTNELPAFFSRDSGHRLPVRVDRISELADIVRMQWDFDLQTGMLIANPVPRLYEIPREEMDDIIHKALAEAAIKQVRGKAITPFLLSKINQLTGGKSLETNIELIIHNARVASQLAIQLKIKNEK